MNTFRRPAIIVVVLVTLGLALSFIGGDHSLKYILYLAGLMIGLGLGIAGVNAFPQIFLDKNTTDQEWREKFKEE